MLVVNRNTFRRRIKKVIQVSIKRSAPWYEYVLSWGGIVRKRECNTAVDEKHARVVTVCRGVEEAKSFKLKPIIIIEGGNGILTVVVGD